MAELKRVDSECPNLLWEPPWDTMDPNEFDPRIHESKYGGGSEARLLSGIAGHNLCVPFWGDPSPAEYTAGMTFHGEAGIVQWHMDSSVDERLRIFALLPASSLRVTRDIRLSGESVMIDSTVENLLPWDRPLAWCEHVTFGPPFLSSNATTIEACLGKGFITGDENGDRFSWPEGRGELRCDLRRFSTEPHRDLVNSFCVNDSGEGSFFLVSNTDLRIRVEYRFSNQEFAWLNVWENNDARMQTRAMEFSNTPRHGTMRKLIASPAVLDKPAYDWVDARGTLKKSFSISLLKLV